MEFIHCFSESLKFLGADQCLECVRPWVQSLEPNLHKVLCKNWLSPPEIQVQAQTD